jgi:hypothetical protein
VVTNSFDGIKSQLEFGFTVTNVSPNSEIDSLFNVSSLNAKVILVIQSGGIYSYLLNQ